MSARYWDPENSWGAAPLDIGQRSFDNPVWLSPDWPPQAMDVLAAAQAEQKVFPSKRANLSKNDRFARR